MIPEREKMAMLNSIFTDVRAGVPLTWARDAVHLHEATFYQWLRNDPKLKETYEEAKGEFRRSLIKKLLDAPDAKYVTWYLERIAPTQFGRAKAHENRATFSDDTKLVLLNDEAPIIDKYNAIISDFVEQKITLEIFKMMIDCLNTVCGASELPEILAMQEKIKSLLEKA